MRHIGDHGDVALPPGFEVFTVRRGRGGRVSGEGRPPPARREQRAPIAAAASGPALPPLQSKAAMPALAVPGLPPGEEWSVQVLRSIDSGDPTRAARPRARPRLPPRRRLCTPLRCRAGRADSAEGFPRSREGAYEAGLSVGKGKVVDASIHRAGRAPRRVTGEPPHPCPAAASAHPCRHPCRRRRRRVLPPPRRRSKLMIVDDEYVVVGSANINQRSLDGARDSEISIGAFQAGHTLASTGGALPRGQVAGFRRALWREHIGALDLEHDDPSSLECMCSLRAIGDANWRVFAGPDVLPLPRGHLLTYPATVAADGAVGPLVDCDEVPDLGGKLLGTRSALPWADARTSPASRLHALRRGWWPRRSSRRCSSAEPPAWGGRASARPAHAGAPVMSRVAALAAALTALLLIGSARAAPRPPGGRGNGTAAANATAPPPATANATRGGGNGSSSAAPPARAPTPAPAVLPAPPACPATLLGALERLVQVPAPRGAGAAPALNASAGAAPRRAPPPPPPPPGVACTLEVGQLAAGAPGGAAACARVAVINNLPSNLYSWQLVWQPGADLAPRGADGAVLIASAAPGGAARAVNGPQSPTIMARGGTASFTVALRVDGNATTAAPRGGAGGGGTGGAGGDSGGAGPFASPAMGAVYLNGLQCTRLPLPPGARTPHQDCAAARWPLGADGRLGPAPPRNASGGPAARAGGEEGAWLACASRFCCGLQVLPAGGAPAPAQAPPEEDNGTVVGAFGGRGEDAGTPAAPGRRPRLPQGPPPPNATAAVAPAAVVAAQAGPADPGGAAGASAEQPGRDGAGAQLAAGLVPALVLGAAVVASLAGLVHVRRRRARRARSRQLLLHLHKEPPPIHLTTAALVRASSGASTDSHGSQPGGAASTASAGSLASAASRTGSAAWPPAPVASHSTAPASFLAAAAAGAAAGPLFRAGSWQGAAGAAQLPALPPRHQLRRSASSPQSLLHQQRPAGQVALDVRALPAPAPLLRSGSGAARLGRAGSLGAPSAGSVAAGADEAAAPPGEGGGRVGSAPGDALARAVSGVSSHDSAASSGAPLLAATPAVAGAGSSLGSTWGSLRRLLGASSSARPPKSSTASPGSSGALPGPPGARAAGALARAGSGGGLPLPHHHRPLGLIRESAPLVGAQLAAPGGLQAAGLAPAWPPGGGAPPVSRRVSPAASAYDDGSSAASNDSAGPAAWHLSDQRQLLEQPGWLSIDFAREVRLERKLGEGGFGQVFRARWRGQVIAVKLVPFMTLTPPQPPHPPLALVSAAPPDGGGGGGAPRPGSHGPGPAAAPGGALAGGMGLAASAASLRAVRGEIRVLSQVVHRDLKPQNVVIDRAGRAKAREGPRGAVCDFGISKMRDASLAASSTRLQGAGTPAYMSPEQFEGSPVTDKVDVFSMAVLLWECCAQAQPWRDLSAMQIIYTVGVQKERLARPARCPDGLWRLITACWAQAPEARPAFADVLAELQRLRAELDGGA
ncbi:hypothetical protein HT031_000400 [Scenedesmus sp. PABB004]|nr:hypothetical protein HT031_000400 [Scenedesmus sp. PABB004]